MNSIKNKKIFAGALFAIVFSFGVFGLAKADTETTPSSTVPASPTSLTATAGKCGSGIVDLSWADNSGGSAHFVVVRAGRAISEKNSSSYQVKKSISSYQVTGLKGAGSQKFYIASCLSGACSDLVGPASVDVSSNCSSVKYSVTVAKKGSGTGTIAGKDGDSEIISCGGDCFGDNIAYDKTGKVVLTATADSGSVFSKWEGDAECNNSTSPTCNLSKTKNHGGVKAVFAKVGDSRGNTVTLNISKNGTGSGTVEIDVNKTSYEAKTCDLSSTCSFSFKKGEKVFLVVTPNSDSKVVSYSGGVTNATNSKSKKCSNVGLSTKNNCYVTMSGNKSITVNFSAKNQ